jgi:hypothetical protein
MVDSILFLINNFRVRHLLKNLFFVLFFSLIFAIHAFSNDMSSLLYLFAFISIFLIIAFLTLLIIGGTIFLSFKKEYKILRYIVICSYYFSYIIFVIAIFNGIVFVSYGKEPFEKESLSGIFTYVIAMIAFLIFNKISYTQLNIPSDKNLKRVKVCMILYFIFLPLIFIPLRLFFL